MEKLKDAAEEVFNELGSNWSETVYHSALQRELSERGISHHSEGSIPVIYKGAPVGRRRPDLFIITEYGLIIAELKAGSSAGDEQLEQYLSMAIENDNLEEIVGGAVIRFNEELEYEYTVVENDSS